MIKRVPRHIGIIPDGNRRWATNRGLNKQDGYDFGIEPGAQIVSLCKNLGIEEITFYGFTIDNLKRSKKQIDAFSVACVNAVKKICEYPGVSVLVVGDTDNECFPLELHKHAKRTDYKEGDIKVNLLVNYGWQWDLSGLDEPCNYQIRERLKSKDISMVDLIIRWGGRKRLSGFLPVQSIYADIYTHESMWPDFKEEHFFEALDWYDKQDITLGG